MINQVDHREGAGSQTAEKVSSVAREEPSFAADDQRKPAFSPQKDQQLNESWSK
jgi:hypothetical protein